MGKVISSRYSWYSYFLNYKQGSGFFHDDATIIFCNKIIKLQRYVYIVHISIIWVIYIYTNIYILSYIVYEKWVLSYVA